MSVRYALQAREDLLQIWLYVAARNSEAVADRVYDRIEESCRLLAEYPQLGPARREIGEGARSLIIDRWMALYRLTPSGAQVMRIVDASRDLIKIEWPRE